MKLFNSLILVFFLTNSLISLSSYDNKETINIDTGKNTPEKIDFSTYFFTTSNKLIVTSILILSNFLLLASEYNFYFIHLNASNFTYQNQKIAFISGTTTNISALANISTLSNLIPSKGIEYDFSYMKKHSYTPSSNEMGVTVAEKQRKLNIFDKDDRIISYSKYPETSVGLILTITSKSKISCTGTLISPLHILTNAHCFCEETKDINGKFKKRIFFKDWQNTYFYPNYRTSNTDNKKTVCSKIHIPNSYLTEEKGQFHSDWAIVTLTKDIGFIYGWMGVSGFDYKNYKSNTPVNLIGYSGDLYRDNPGAHYNCFLSSATLNFFSGSCKQIIHDCDSTKGSSGAGIYKNFEINNRTTPRIIALHHAAIVLTAGRIYAKEFSSTTANLALATKPIVRKLINILEEIYNNSNNASHAYDIPNKKNSDINYNFILIPSASIVSCCFGVFLYRYCSAKNNSDTPKDKSDLDIIENGDISL